MHALKEYLGYRKKQMEIWHQASETVARHNRADTAMMLEKATSKKDEGSRIRRSLAKPRYQHKHLWSRMRAKSVCEFCGITARQRPAAADSPPTE